MYEKRNLLKKVNDMCKSEKGTMRKLLSKASTLIIIALFVISIFNLSIPIVSAPEPTPEWAMFRHDLAHTGTSSSSTSNSYNPPWSYTTGDSVWSSPTVVDGKVYVGSADNKTYCFDAATGASIWNYTTGNQVWSSPAVVEGAVYVGSYDGNVYALESSTGSKIWNYTTNGMVGSSPAVVGGVVYVGSDDGSVYALNAATGNKIWNYTTASNGVESCPAVVGGVVYIGSYDGNVYALDSSTGNKIWNYTTNGMVASSPAVVDGKVYAGSLDNNTYCFDAASGNLIWIYPTGGIVGSSPAVVGDVVYVASFDNNVYALNASTGAKLWSYATGSGVFSSPAVADGKVYVGSFDKNIYCFNATTGSPIWSYTTGGSIFSSPAIADGKVYVGSSNGRVYCLDAAKGVSPGDLAQIIFSCEASGECIVAPVLGPQGDLTSFLGQGSMQLNGTVSTAPMVADSMPGITGGPYTLYLPSSGVASRGQIVASWSGQEINLTLSSSNAEGFFINDIKYQDAIEDIVQAGVWPGGSYYNPTPSALTYTGSIKNSSGTFPISGYAIASASPLPTDNGSLTPSSLIVVWVFNPDGSSLKAFIWSPITAEFSVNPPLTLQAATVFRQSVDIFPSVTSSVTSSEGSIFVDQTAITGVNITISGSSISDGTVLNVTSVNYGATQPFGTGPVLVEEALFYDVKVISNASIESGTSVFVYFSNPNFTSNSVISYWNGSSWLSVPTIFVSPNILRGTFTVSQLQGAPIMVEIGLDQSADNLAIVARGADNSIWYRISDGSTWTDWTNLIGSTSVEPATAIFQGNLYIAAIDGSTHIWLSSVDLDTQVWSGWSMWPNTYASSVTFASSDNYLAILARGTDNSIWYRINDGSNWSDWINLVGSTTIEPAVAIFQDKLYIAAIDGSTHIWLSNINLNTQVWSGWNMWQGTYASSVTFAASTDNLAIVARGVDNSIWYRVYDGSNWNDWTNLIGSTVIEPAAAIYQGQLYIAAIDGSSHIWLSSIDLDTQAWSGWSMWQGTYASSITFAS
jgi:outer membrane protein assembly factor BamB